VVYIGGRIPTHRRLGADRVGYRISPNGAFHSMSDSNPVETFSYIAEQLNKLGIVYLHVVDPVADGAKRMSHYCAGTSIKPTSLMAALISTAPMRRSMAAKPISLLWHPVSRQSRSAPAISDKRFAQRAGPGDILYRGRQRLHRLSVSGVK